MYRRKLRRPPQVVVIALFQFAKAACLLTVFAWLWISPDSLPNSAAFNQVLFVAAHGKSLTGILVPVFGLYMIYVGVGLLNLRRRFRRNLAISSAITIGVSLQRLGLFGETTVTNSWDRETLYILILLDFAVYIYLAFHPEIARTFKND